MPAVALTRLRTQINRILLQFDQPEAFCAALRELLELNANFAYRPGQAVQPQPLLPSYRISPLIMRQLEIDLARACHEQPEHALAIISALWADPYLEPRLLAASLLGSLPRAMDDQVLEKLRAWVTPDQNFRMIDSLFQTGTAGLRQGAAQSLLALVEEWLSSQRQGLVALGLRALVPLVADPQFDNIPAVFRLLRPQVQIAHAPLLANLQAALEAMIRRTPTETAFFLRQALSIAHSANASRLVRRCLPSFSPEQQTALREALRSSRDS